MDSKSETKMVPDETPTDLANPQGESRERRQRAKRHLSAFSKSGKKRKPHRFPLADYLDVSPARDGGVLKKVLKPGDGEVPPGADQGKIDVKVHYTGWLLDG